MREARSRANTVRSAANTGCTTRLLTTPWKKVQKYSAPSMFRMSLGTSLRAWQHPCLCVTKHGEAKTWQESACM